MFHETSLPFLFVLPSVEPSRSQAMVPVQPLPIWDDTIEPHKCCFSSNRFVSFSVWN
ncbi:MAG: hypothetical protein H7126_17120 [Candidatus Parcubacteria bacterium]|uniref:hypothetical protein n=1 Tax=Phormidesmis priestleyi TaxID=268141 RepID=UPI0012E92CBA|nr:hypothetical protein [Phormidesmis priestleyi]MBC7825547.1 hypothetical protein [Leptolyngbyaceae cyanobacterium LF-bin-113]